MAPEISLQWGHSTYALHTYTVFALLSVGLGLSLVYLQLRKWKASVIHSLVFCGILGLSFVTGARLLNYGINYSKYRNLGVSLTSLKFGYFSLYGGILLSALVAAVWAKHYPISYGRFFDGLTVPFLLSFPLMKVGCFLNGCCYGTITHVPWGVPLPLMEQQNWASNPFAGFLASPETIRVYPVQLMEAGAALITALIVLRLRKKLPEGSTFFLTAFLFSGARLFLLPFRSLDYGYFVVKQMYPALYAGIMVFCVIMLIKNSRKTKTENQIQ